MGRDSVWPMLDRRPHVRLAIYDPYVSLQDKHVLKDVNSLLLEAHMFHCWQSLETFTIRYSMGVPKGKMPEKNAMTAEPCAIRYDHG